MFKKAFILLFLTSASALWAEPSELQLFHRCYSQLTGIRAKSNHPTLLKVASGELKAFEGCMEILDKGLLFTSGPNLGRTQGEVNPSSAFDADEAQALMRTFLSFHKSWIGTGSLLSAINWGSDAAGDEIYSRYEFASYLTYLLFHPTLTYRDFVTGVRSVQEVRDGASPNGRFGQFYNPTELYALSHLKHNFLPGGLISDPTKWEDIPINFLPQGVLHGFRELNSSEKDARMKLGFIASGASYTNPYENTAYNYLQNTKFRNPKGGGVIGTPSYMLLNLGAGWTQSGFPRSNGAGKMWRRMIRNSFSDLMCRSLPTVNVSDVISYVRPSSTLPYRSNASCMTCHATLDLGAGTFRNFNISSTKVTRGLPDGSPRVLEAFSLVSHPSVVTDPTNLIHESLRDGAAATYSSVESDLLSIDGNSGDSSFFKRPPNGRFITRTYDGTLIDKAIYDIEGYGNEIAQTDDYYICAAKRYVNFFTGFDASMQEVPNSSAEEIQSREFVIQLGLQLKQTQSLRGMIQSILSSDLYRGAYE